jgi:hypothetical protein
VEQIAGLDNEFMTVLCAPALGLVQHTMHRFVVSAAFREGLGLELMRAHQATKWQRIDGRAGLPSTTSPVKVWSPRRAAWPSAAAPFDLTWSLA